MDKLNNKHLIMVVEDENSLLQAIVMKLHKHGHETVSCTSGKQAIDYLQDPDLPDLPDLIWLDYYLKDTNGLEFMNELVKNEKTKKIPVIVVSNSASSEKVKAMLGLGVRKYILKAEHSLEEIVSSIDDFIKDLQ